jgi:hypothetical protein
MPLCEASLGPESTVNKPGRMGRKNGARKKSKNENCIVEDLNSLFIEVWRFAFLFDSTWEWELNRSEKISNFIEENGKEVK